MQTRNFDSSALTKRNQGRMLYANYLIRNTSVNKNPGLIARPLATGSPIGSGSGVNYANYVEEVRQGAFQTTPAEQQRIINENFPTPAPPIIPVTPVTPDPTPEDTTSWGYYIIYDGLDDTYQYIIYDDSTKLWSGPLGSGLYIYDYYIDELLSYTPNGFVIGYGSYSELGGYYRYALQYLPYTASTIVRTISYTEYGDYNSYVNQYISFIYYLDPDTDFVTVLLYNNETDVLKTKTYSSDTTVYDYVLLRTGVYLILTTDYTTYTHYMWNINDNEPTLLFSNMNYNYESDLSYYYDYIFIASSADGTIIDTLYCVEGNTTIHPYVIPNATNYTSIPSMYGWGPYYKFVYLSLYNNSTSSLDFFMFKNLPDPTPTNTLLDVTGPLIFKFYYNDDPNEYKTGETDTFVLSEFQASPYYIKTGGVEGTTPIYDSDNYGNYIQLEINNGNNDQLLSQSYSKVYGSKLNTTLSPSEDGTQYGYLVSPANVYPHNVMTFISDLGGYNSGSDSPGTLKIDVYDSLAVRDLEHYVLDNTDYDYFTSSSRRGHYYAQQLSGVPGQPSVCHVWFTIENDNWSGSFASGAPNGLGSESYDYQVDVTITGYNIIFCKVLLSAYDGTVGQHISDLNIQAFLSNYVGNADLMSDSNNFSTLDMVRFRNWQQSNDYTSFIPNFYKYTYDYNHYDYPNYSRFVNGTLNIWFDNSKTIKEITGNTMFSYNHIHVNNAGVNMLLSNDSNITSYLVTPTTDISTNIMDVNEYNAERYDIRSTHSDNYYFWLISTRIGNEYRFEAISPLNEVINNALTGTTYYDWVISKDSIIFLTYNTLYIFINGVKTKIEDFDTSPYFNNYNYSTSYPDTDNGYNVYYYINDNSLSNIITTSSNYTATIDSITHTSTPGFLVSDNMPYVNNYAMISNYVMYSSSGYNSGLLVVVADSEENIYEYNPDESYGWTSDSNIVTTPTGFYQFITNSNDSSYALLTFNLSNKSFGFVTDTTVPTAGQYIDDTYSTYYYTW